MIRSFNRRTYVINRVPPTLRHPVATWDVYCISTNKSLGKFPSASEAICVAREDSAK